MISPFKIIIQINYKPQIIIGVIPIISYYKLLIRTVGPAYPHVCTKYTAYNRKKISSDSSTSPESPLEVILPLL